MRIGDGDEHDAVNQRYLYTRHLKVDAIRKRGTLAPSPRAFVVWWPPSIFV